MRRCFKEQTRSDLAYLGCLFQSRGDDGGLGTNDNLVKLELLSLADDGAVAELARLEKIGKHAVIDSRRRHADRGRSAQYNNERSRAVLKLNITMRTRSKRGETGELEVEGINEEGRDGKEEKTRLHHMKA